MVSDLELSERWKDLPMVPDGTGRPNDVKKKTRHTILLQVHVMYTIYLYIVVCHF